VKSDQNHFSGNATTQASGFPVDKFAVSLAATNASPIRRALEMVVAVSLIVFAFSQPNTSAGLRYFLDAVAVLFLCLTLLRKWP